eukprot:gene15122-14869_t
MIEQQQSARRMEQVSRSSSSSSSSMGSSSTPARRLLLLLVVAITSSTIAKAEDVECRSGGGGWIKSMKGTSAGVNFYNAIGQVDNYYSNTVTLSGTSQGNFTY